MLVISALVSALVLALAVAAVAAPLLYFDKRRYEHNERMLGLARRAESAGNYDFALRLAIVAYLSPNPGSRWLNST